MSISDLKVLQPKVFADDRGYFFESYNHGRFEKEIGRKVVFIQDNQSSSVHGVLRGLHYQLSPYPQGKLVHCVRGAVWDVAVDIRRSSATFGDWFGLELNDQNHSQLWIPEGFAHGFVALSDEAILAYKATSYYASDYDRSIRWDDPAIGIDWPIDRPRMSDKDRTAPLLSDVEVFP